MSLSTYLSVNHITDYEGHSGQIPQQTARLAQLCDDPSIQRILEIGFNVGHSADTFLSHSLAHVTSFDLQARDSVQFGKTYIDKKFPGRHTLIIGDSMQTIPNYAQEAFDLIYIDGGHTEEIARADLMNCKRLAHANTIVIMDDVILTVSEQRDWSLGPSMVWAKSILEGVVHNHQYEAYAPGRGMGWGNYRMA